MGSVIGSKRNVKIYILYLMVNIGYPLDYVTLNEIIRQNDFVIWLDFAESFHELIDLMLIEEVGKNEHNEPLYEVTPQGRLVADTLHGDILSTILDKSLADALRYLDFKRRGIESHCRSEKLPDGRVRVTVQLLEKKEVIFQTELVVDTVNRAERMLDNFREHPDVIYRGTLGLLAGNVNYLLLPPREEL